MKRIIRKLEQGKPVCLFPEGTRTSDGKIATLKGGFGLIARRAKVPIVPAIIDGAYECWPRQNKMFKVCKKITICYGQVISADQVNSMKDRELAEVITDTLRKMQAQCREMAGKEGYVYENSEAKSS
jgi:1-acyl-sn-glycerol-3-phosphate acyltransferase